MIETGIHSDMGVIKIVTNMHQSTKQQINDNKKQQHNNKELLVNLSNSTISSSSLSSMHRNNKCRQKYMGCNRKRITSGLSQRIISAKFIHIKQLQSELTEAYRMNAELKEENGILRNIQKRQGVALEKYEGQDATMPQLLKSHEEQLRVANTKYKQLRSSYRDLEERFKNQGNQLNVTKERYARLLRLSQDKQLGQRDYLTKQIEQMKTVHEEQKEKIKLLTRKLDLQSKNYKHELNVELQKQKKLQLYVTELEERVEKLQQSLQEKQKLISGYLYNKCRGITTEHTIRLNRSGYKVSATSTTASTTATITGSSNESCGENNDVSSDHSPSQMQMTPESSESSKRDQCNNITTHENDIQSIKLLNIDKDCSFGGGGESDDDLFKFFKSCKDEENNIVEDKDKTVSWIELHGKETDEQVFRQYKKDELIAALDNIQAQQKDKNNIHNNNNKYDKIVMYKNGTCMKTEK